MKTKNIVNKETMIIVKMNMVLLILLTIFTGTASAVTCDNGYYYKEGVINGSSDFGGLAKWNGSDFAAFWFDKIYPLYDKCKENEYLKVSQSNINSSQRTIDKGNLTYYTKRIITPYTVFNQTGKGVEYALDKYGYKVVSGGFYARISCFGRPCVAINGNSSRVARILLEHVDQDSDIKTMISGEDWELKEGWNITISDINVTNKEVTIRIDKDGTLKDVKIVKEGDVYTYIEKWVIDENDVPVFVTYIYNITAESGTDIVKLKYSWLMSDNASSIAVGGSPTITLTIIGGPTEVLTTTKVDKYGIEMKNSNQDVLLSNSAIIKLIDNIYLIVKDKSSLSYLPIMIRNDTTPPYRVSNLTNISYANNYINWTWTDPSDYDFEKVIVYLNGNLKGYVQKGIRYYNATGLSPYTSYTIGTRTVDISGNIGVWHNRTAKTAKDVTPPASITGLKNITYKSYYINWTWTDPKDSDFAKVMIYINGAYKGNVSKGKRYYNATNLSANIWYKISTRTVDIYGNINQTWKNHSARTTPDSIAPGSVTGLHDITYAPTYINWTWKDPKDLDLSGVLVYVNGIYKGKVLKGKQYYNATNLTPDRSYNVSTRTVDVSGNINDTWINHSTRTALLNNKIRFITVGDPHIDDSNSGPGSSQDLLKKVVNYINKSDADFAVILGDTVISDTDVGDFDAAQNILTNINKTYYVIPGNHDVGFDNDSTNYVSHFGPMERIVNIKGYQLLFIGIWQNKNSADQDVIHWRFNFSKANKEKPTIVFIHGAIQNSPSGACFNWNSSTRYFKYGYNMQSELDKFTKLIGVYSGHVHSDSDQIFSTPLVEKVRYTTIDGLVKLDLGSCRSSPTNKVGYSIVQDGKLSYSQTPYDIFTSGMLQQMMTQKKELDKEEIEYQEELKTGEVS